MNASKENARVALDHLYGQEARMNPGAYGIIKRFLQMAIRRLPTEASFERAAATREKRRKKKEPA